MCDYSSYSKFFFQGCITYVCHEQGCAFTGDTLLIRGCGRTDFQEGSANTLYDSVWNHILSLPENFKLYPAHDYKGEEINTIKVVPIYMYLCLPRVNM